MQTQAVTQPSTPAGLVLRSCGECGKPFASPSPTVEFCGTDCRKAWNNRRAVRGAEMYDLFMALRFDRPTATRLHVWKAVCRMATYFRAEDLREREGRLSWRAPATILERRPYLLSTLHIGRN